MQKKIIEINDKFYDSSLRFNKDIINIREINTINSI